VIVSLAGANAPDLRAFKIAGEQIEEVTLEPA